MSITVSHNYWPETSDDVNGLEEWEKTYERRMNAILEPLRPEGTPDEDYPPEELIDELDSEYARLFRTYKRENGNLVHFYDLVNAFLQSGDEAAETYLEAIEDWYREDAAPQLLEGMNVDFPNKIERPIKQHEYEELVLSNAIQTLIQDREQYTGEEDLISGDTVKKPIPLTEEDAEE